jgi:hydrogenase nickel incorporation protein HypB
MNIRVIKNVLEASDSLAAANRQRLTAAGVLGVNILSAPGSGKTSLLQKTIPALTPRHRCAVLVGDLQTSRDAERLSGLGAEVIQINTGRGCHLTPEEVAEGVGQIDLKGVSFLFIENVGNMVCPAAFDLGEHLRAVLLSVPEGDDKVAKYPTLFQKADVILLSKVDLLKVLDYDSSRPRADLAGINTAAPLIELSVKSGQGFDRWLEWLEGQWQRRVKA